MHPGSAQVLQAQCGIKKLLESGLRGRIILKLEGPNSIVETLSCRPFFPVAHSRQREKECEVSAATPVCFPNVINRSVFRAVPGR